MSRLDVSCPLLFFVCFIFFVLIFLLACDNAAKLGFISVCRVWCGASSVSIYLKWIDKGDLIYLLHTHTTGYCQRLAVKWHSILSLLTSFSQRVHSYSVVVIRRSLVLLLLVYCSLVVSLAAPMLLCCLPFTYYVVLIWSHIFDQSGK